MVFAEKKSERPVDALAGHLWIRLAENEGEIFAAQRLRYRVFYEGMAARPTEEMARERRDFDEFDPYCDHLIVFDQRRGRGEDAVVGTYRVMRRESARLCGRFYTAGEYDISMILAYPGEVLELGRSCVDNDYRTGSTMQLLWRGISEYVFTYDIDLMFGCASLPGTNRERLKLPLAYLYHKHLAPADLRPRALPERYESMDTMPLEAIDAREAQQALPPLVKGYLRLGGYVGDGAVVDYDFGTTDVCVLVHTDLVTEKYYRHFKREEREDPRSISE